MLDNPSFIHVPVFLSLLLFLYQPPSLQPPALAPHPRPRGCPRGRTARQAGRARRPAAGGERCGEKAGRRAEKARWRTVSVPAAVRSELRESARKLARKFPNSRRNGVDSCQKGELASLLYPEIPGEISPVIKIPGNGEKRAHANAGPYSASPLRR